MADSDEPRCFCGICDIVGICGHRLRDGVQIVLLSTIAIAFAFFLTSLILRNNLNWENVNSDPVKASLFIFSLVAIPMSPYQIILSLILFRQVSKIDANIFVCSMWYTSHLNIMVVYFILFAATSVGFFLDGHAVSGYLMLLFLILYEVMFAYYCAIINGYLLSLPQDESLNRVIPKGPVELNPLLINTSNFYYEANSEIPFNSTGYF